MKFGQMSLLKLSDEADYLQLDICGLTPEEAVARYVKYAELKGDNFSIILHGDWAKKGASENKIETRYKDYIEIIRELKQITQILGITIHPPLRNKVKFQDFIFCCGQIEFETRTPVYWENRSNHKIWGSQPEEVIAFSLAHAMTIDIPQLYISCGYNDNLFYDVLERIDWNEVKEIHLGNVQRQIKHTYVARKLEDGFLDYSKIFPYISSVPLATLEILGGTQVFESQKKWIEGLIN